MKRVQLTWSRNKDDSTKSYRVFRAIHPSVTRKDILIMEVEHNVIPKPVLIKQDTLIRSSTRIYDARYKNIMPVSETHPVSVLMNGVSLDSLGVGYSINYEKGQFIFDTDFGLGDVITATYYIDGIRVLDTDELTQEGVKYFGPAARDRTENTIPENVSLLPDVSLGRLVLTWGDASTQGQKLYYRIEALDEFGNFSILSEEKLVFLKEGLGNDAYIVERSFDNTNWHTVSKQADTKYIEYGIDTEPPEAPLNPAASVARDYGESTGAVTLTWEKPGLGLPSASPRYRVRSVSATGSPSQPSPAVGPVYLTSDVGKYVIRRKIYDGSFPTYDGTDGVTVGIVEGDVLTFTDLDVPDNTQYAYSLFAVDSADNPSIAAILTVEIGDATPPAAIDGISVEVYSYLI